MTKHILTFGAISGVIVIVFMLISFSMMTGENGQYNFDNGETFGYVSMIIALSVIFFGIKSYRDQQLSGNITFGNAFKIGILITLVASLFYMIAWMVYINTVGNVTEFMDQYLKFSIDKMIANGASQTEIDQYREQSESFAKMYENPLVMAGMTLLEIFPVGLAISLLSSIFLKKSTNKF